ncbi:MAG: SDR family oxidoreductase [Actinobacteria bacterium]|jgi:2-dehydro-3-deoxy-L-rhamnonate dehydrogenase (NAD+)|nr:SDR family oxidoreductase [Actinomycetota bacterium]NBO51091.1 SDR family oxidoreductase [Actinomycetota bacterium]NBQ60514.1 SDR family oxidoreductase [Actinomycetota bacterium]NBY82618.1 SDR family oxidoreductase [Actinomycetota bacterium]NCA25944.1 SDR family oxidoreductase [Actinomycetota bacterium]
MSDDIAFEQISYSGQVVVVTGAASGIGRAAAELIATRGAKVICVDLNQSGVDETVASILKVGGKAESAVLDISDQKKISDLVSSINNKDKRIDALINCAGYPGPTGKFVEDINWDDFQKVIAVNLFGAIWLTQAVLPIMKRQKYGRIVQVASIAGKEGNPKMAPYNTAKSGLIGFVKGVAKEIATDGITINALAPAVIATPINVNTAKETLDYMISKIPAGRLGEPSEVAEIIAFMGSKACSFTTGFTFDISGGRATY